MHDITGRQSKNMAISPSASHVRERPHLKTRTELFSQQQGEKAMASPVNLTNKCFFAQARQFNEQLILLVGYRTLGSQ